MHPVTQMFDLIEGPIRFALMRWAMETNVFDLCETQTSAADIAAEIKTDPERTERALQALVASGFLQCKGRKYRVPPKIAPYVLSDSPQCFRQTFLDLSQTRHAGLSQIAKLIEGKALHGQPTPFDATHWQRQQRSLTSFHRSVATEEMLQALKRLPEWAAARSILDVGGGSLEFARAIVAERPGSSVTLFDLPGMIENLPALSDTNIATCGGNYNQPADLPNGPFDLIWCSMSLYFADNLTDTLSALRDRLSPSGVLVSFHEDLSENRCLPPRHVLGRTLPALAGKDLSFSNGAIAAQMQRTGLTAITSEIIETPFGPFRLDAGRRT